MQLIVSLRLDATLGTLCIFGLHYPSFLSIYLHRDVVHSSIMLRNQTTNLHRGCHAPQLLTWPGALLKYHDNQWEPQEGLVHDSEVEMTPGH